jgi:ABC-2 type transport system permease protein
MNKFIWLLRREVWESRAIWIAPAICAGLAIIGALLFALSGPFDVDAETLQQVSAQMTPEKTTSLVGFGLAALAIPFFVAVTLVQVFYAADALYGERRDRSILFWKSLPVSDSATVLSKLTVAAVVMPLTAAVAAIGTQVVVCAILSAKLAALLPVVPHLWSPVAWGSWLASLLYLLVAGAIWYLPVLAWLLLVSSWAPRSPLMFGLGSPLALIFAEFLLFRTHHLGALIGERIGNTGFLARAMGHPAHDGGAIVIHMKHFDVPESLFSLMQPAQYFASPDVWLGVLVAAAMVAATIWMRRYRDTVA